ncbi:MAG: molecular chaperone DnaJ, partial [Anaerobutyricum soehngenii]|nr:molecular chaperone DnaJ [Anaerobutyricum soehngenii]
NIRGTHIVKFVVQVPEKMNAAQKEALRNFQEAMGEVVPSEKKEEAPHEKHEKHKKKGFFKK